MGTIRTLLIAGAALLAGFVSIHAPARAASKAAGAPLSLTPPALQAKKPPPSVRLTKVRKPIRTAKRRAAPPVVAQGGDQDLDTVMRGDDSIGLIARLPWWHSDPWESIRLREKAGASQVLTIAEGWVGPGAQPIETPAAQAAPDDDVHRDSLAASALADPSELNAIDLATANQGVPRSWLKGLVAMLGGALAAAAVGLLLFARRGRSVDPSRI